MLTSSLLKTILHVLMDENFEILNEATLQNEIAFKLKNQLSKNYTIQLERNINLHNKSIKAVKRDMDIFIKNNSGYQSCIEIKAPLGKSFQKRHINTMKDIAFLEVLKSEGYHDCFSIFISKHIGYKTHFQNKISANSLFRNGKNNFEIKNEYEIVWDIIHLKNSNGSIEPYYFFILEI